MRKDRSLAGANRDDSHRATEDKKPEKQDQRRENGYSGRNQLICPLLL